MTINEQIHVFTAVCACCEDPSTGGLRGLVQPTFEELFELRRYVEILLPAVNRDDQLGSLQTPFSHEQLHQSLRGSFRR